MAILSLNLASLLAMDLQVLVDGHAVFVSDLHSKSTIWDVACELEDMGFSIDIAFPDVTAEGKKIDGSTIIKRKNLLYKFCKLLHKAMVKIYHLVLFQ